MEHSGFPSHETLAAFIDGRLDSQTRKRVMEHMATCAECRSTFVGAVELRGLDTAAFPRRYRLRWASAAAAALLIGAVLAGGFLVRTRNREPLPPGVDALIAAAGDFPNRPADGRITGFPYRPKPRVLRSAPATEDSSKWKTISAGNKIFERADRNPSAENLHAYGISFYAVGSAEMAVAQLEAAVRKETGHEDVKQAIGASHDAQLLSDLSAAYLAVAGQKEQNHQWMLSATSAADRAWELAPDSPEVLWNRAASYEAWPLRQKARDAWNDYLRVDSTSRWAAEARTRRDELERPPQSELWERERQTLDEKRADAPAQAKRLAVIYPQEAREYAQGTLLPCWGEEALAGDEDAAARTLAMVRAIGEASAAKGDTLLVRTVAHIESKRARRALAEGFVAWHEGQKAYDDSKMAEAESHLQIAVANLTAAGSPFAGAVRRDYASAAFNQNDYETVLVRLAAIPQDDLEASPWLRGRVLWLSALAETVLGRQKLALDHYQQAFDDFRQLGEVDNQLAVQNLMAINDDYTADTTRAWQRRFDSFRKLHQLGSSRRAQYVFTDASRAAAREGQVGAARVFADEMVRVARISKLPAAISDAYLNRGVAQFLSGRIDAAQRDLEHAEHWAARIPDEDMRARTIANTELTAYNWRNGESPDVAIGRLSNAIEFFEETEKRFYLPRLHFLRARVACGAGRAQACEADLKAGLSEASQELKGLRDPILFGTYLQTVREATDGLASILVRRGDARASLPYIDCNRLLFAASNAKPVACASTDQALTASVQKRLPAHSALLELAVIDDQLLAWLITADDVRFEQRKMGLFRGERMLEPFADALPNLQSLVIVNDPAFADVPLPSLRNPATGRYLIEDLDLTTIPSAATFAASVAPGVANGTALVVCNAAYDQAGLKPLRFADDEALATAAAYRRHEILRGKDATRQRFLEDAGDASVVHYVGHSVSQADSPLLAALALAPASAQDSGLLTARDIARAKFPHTSLVVLSACSTAAADRREEAGVTNLARAFLAAGVPGVIASTTPVDDATAPEMFRRLHGLLAQGVAPPRALRTVQIEMIRRGAPPNAWAGFQYLGSI
ncbi:MAG: CHAT domain-containing protein [Acidobacteria bacterium]|nr:CHAT domain-containing protein [Acidobacteriota bacterium]